MKRYRSKSSLRVVRPQSNDAWVDDWNCMAKDITVFETEAEWQPIGILGPDGNPIEALVGGMEPIGFLHEYFEQEDEV
jgi:hypothetical protein